MFYSRTDAGDIPQANSLTKIANTATAVDEGAVTTEEVAIAIDVVKSGGAYYGKAARLLGLVQSRDTTPVIWSLTPTGTMFVGLDSAGKAELLSDLVLDLPAVQVYLDGDESDVAETFADEAHLSESTAVRRASTIKAWLDAITDPKNTAATLAEQSSGVRSRARDAVSARVPRVIPLSIPPCEACWTTPSATGVCMCG